jgi:hypothetical protein
MAQKRYTIGRDEDIEDVVVASDATSLSGGVVRIIVSDDADREELEALIEAVKNRFIQDDFPFA